MAQLTADQLVQLARQGNGKNPVDLGQSATTIGVDGEVIPKSTQLNAAQLVAMAKQQQRANYKPFDWKASQKEGMTQAAKAEGQTQPWESALLGVTNLGAAAAQGYYLTRDGLSKGANALIGSNLPTDAYNQFTKERNETEDWHKLRREVNEQGFDGWRLGGELLNPLAAYGKSYQGAKILSGMGAKITGQNALVGMGIGGASFAENSGDRLSHSIAGGIGGAAGGVIGEKIGQGARKVVDKTTQLGKNFFTNISQEKTQKLLQSIDEKLEAALRPEGISLNDLSQTVVKSLRDDAIKAVQSGKNLNPTAVARKVVLDRLGLKGTRAQVSGDAAQWQHEAELAKIQNAGTLLRDKFIDDDKQLTRLLEEAEQSTGGKSIDRYGVMDSALESIQNQLGKNKEYINSLYNSAQKAQGNEVKLGGAEFVKEVNQALKDNYATMDLPASISSILKRFKKSPDEFTLGESEAVIKKLNEAHQASLKVDGTASSGTHATSLVREALNNRQSSVFSQNNTAAELYQLGRQAYGFNANQIESMPLLKDAVKGVEPDKLFNKHILGGNVAELDKTVQLLKNVNPQVVNDIRQQVVGYIREQAFNSNGKPSPSGMKKALDNITDRRLSILFTPKEMSRIKDISKAMDYLVTQPNHSYVNNSNSSSGLTNSFMKFLNIPGVRESVFTKPLADIGNSNRVSKVMNPSISGEANPSIISPELIDRLVKAGIISGSNLPNQ